jgi:hypothetical protein
MYDYLEMKRWKKKRKPKFPKLKFPIKPWPVASKLIWFLFNTAKLAFVKMWIGTFERVVLDATGIRRPQGIPKWPQRIIFWLCGVNVVSFLFSLYCLFAKSYWGILAIVVAMICHIVIWIWLRRNFPPVPTP